MIRACRPELILTHWKGSMHKDHANTYAVMPDAIFYAALRTIQRELGLPTLPEPPDVADALAVALCHYYVQRLPA